ncbi:MAG: RecX family transcriptional regulator [Clostridia bacterium]|nr:RecX family transcriptional regulator [Clostridia bacterium]
MPLTDENGFLVFDPGDPGDGASEGEKRAYRSGRGSLSWSDCTERTLRRKLRQKGFSESETEYAVARLKDERLLDDRAFAERRFSYLAYEKKYGARRIKSELYESGVGADVISSLPFDGVDFTENCRHHLSLLGEMTPKTKNRLLRLGFSYSEIKEAEEKSNEKDS